MNPRKYAVIGAAFSLCLLILDSKTAFSGAAEGMEICMRTVIPTLFPFFILSIYLTGQDFSFPGLPALCRLFGIPKGCESILINGFLGGYPTGAKTVADLWRSGTISRENANRMLSFCSQAGPSFLFGIVAMQFTDREYPWLLWIIQILSALIVSRFFPADDLRCSQSNRNHFISLGEALRKAISVTGIVCGWVIVFRIITQFFLRWFLWILPMTVQIAITGLLELANGCVDLSLIADDRIRFLLVSPMLSFGGICVAMQTASVTEGLDLRYYFWGKLLQSLVSLGFASVFVGYPRVATVSTCILGLIFLLKMRKSSGIPIKAGV